MSVKLFEGDARASETSVNKTTAFVLLKDCHVIQSCVSAKDALIAESRIERYLMLLKS